MGNDLVRGKRGGDSGTSASSRDTELGPGKQTLVERVYGAPVQLREIHEPGVPHPGAVHAAAAQGVATPSQSLPHFDTVQRAFGRHDISRIHAHVGGDAAASTRAMGATAYATGNHVVLGQGTDLHTVAHEAAHVIQQRGGVQLKGGVGEVGDAYEQQADQVADAVVQGRSAEGLLGEPRGGAALGAGGAIQRSPDPGSPAPAGPYPPPNPGPPPIPTWSGPDQHAGAQPPDATAQPGVWGHLNPNSTTAGPSGVVKEDEWDGLSSNAKSAANRAAATAQLTKAMRDYLDSQAADIAKARLASRVPMTQAGSGSFAGKDTGVQGIAALASSAIQTKFGGEMRAAAMTSSQRAASTQTMQSGVNLFDGNDAAQRAAAMGQTPEQLAWGTAWWIATSTDAARNTLAKHHWSPGRGGEEDSVFNNLITTWLGTGSNKVDALDYRVFGLNEAGPGGKILLITRTDPTAWGGDQNRADKAQRWEIFRTAIHETMHTRAHAAFNAAIGDKQVMREGFCEMFSKDIGDPLLAAVRGGSNEPLRKGVEGKDEPVLPEVIPANYAVAGVYQTFFDHATAIRKTVGDAACQAAFFQGHVEFLGLNPDGTRATPPPAGARRLQVPAGVANVDQLAAASGVTRAQLISDNPGIDTVFPTGGQAVMPGCREHVVVDSSDAGGSTVERRDEIAAQNGVSEAALVRANPGIRVDPANNQWAALGRGARVLIPVH